MSNPSNPLIVAAIDAPGSPVVGMEDFEVVDHSSGEEDAIPHENEAGSRGGRQASLRSPTRLQQSGQRIPFRKHWTNSRPWLWKRRQEVHEK